MEATKVTFAEKLISEFLDTAEPSIMCLKGDWGVGKTYLWKTVYEQQTLKKLTYSYVSLFGINSISELKIAIYTNSSSFINYKKAINLVKDNASAVLEKYTGINININTDTIANLAIKDYIICLDDIERRGENLKLKDILGFANDLKEIKNCRTILLINLKEGVEKEINDFNLYNEKVIDTTIALKPTLDECLAIIKLGKTNLVALSDDLISSFKDACECCETNNIRMIAKTAKSFNRFYYDFELDKYDTEIKNSILYLFVLLSYCHYTGANNSSDADEKSVPSLDIIKGNIETYFGGLFLYNAAKYQYMTPEEKKNNDKYSYWFNNLRNKKVYTGEKFIFEENYLVDLGVIEFIIDFLRQGYNTNKYDLISFLDNFKENKEANMLMSKIYLETTDYTNDLDAVSNNLYEAMLKIKDKYCEQKLIHFKSTLEFLYEYKDKDRYLNLIKEYENFISENYEFKKWWNYKKKFSSNEPNIPEIDSIIYEEPKSDNEVITLEEFAEFLFIGLGSTDIENLKIENNLKRFKKCSYDNLKVLLAKNYDKLKYLASNPTYLSIDDPAYTNLKKLLDDLEKDDKVTMKHLITDFKTEMGFYELTAVESHNHPKPDASQTNK